MQSLRTTILEHHRRQDRHYDWLVQDPLLAGQEHSLWACRISLPPHAWVKDKPMRLMLTALPPHRAWYLDHHNTLTDGRGWVRIVSQGHVQNKLWTPSRIEWAVQLPSWQGKVTMQKTQTGYLALFKVM